MTVVFTDASSAILLFRAGLFERAARTLSMVVSGEVLRELTREGYAGAGYFRELSENGTIRVVQKEPDLAACSPLKGWAGLDRGEQETIALYQGFKDRSGAFVLMDDGQGARFCTRHYIPFINALLVPKVFWYSGLMTETHARKEMKTLSEIGRYSQKILSKACDLTREELAFFVRTAAVGEGRP